MALFAGRAEVSSDLASAVALLEKHAILRAEGVEGVGEGDDQLECGDRKLQLQLHLTNALEACANADDGPPPRRHLARALHTLMGSLFGAAARLSCGWQLPSHSTLSLEPSALYAALEEHTTSASRPALPVPPLPALRPTLKPHQRDAVGPARALTLTLTLTLTLPRPAHISSHPRSGPHSQPKHELGVRVRVRSPAHCAGGVDARP